MSLRAPGAAELREELSVESDEVAAERAGYLYGPFGIEDGIETLEDAGRTARASWSEWRRELRAYLDGEMPPAVQHEGGWRGSGVVRCGPDLWERAARGWPSCADPDDLAAAWRASPEYALGALGPGRSLWGELGHPPCAVGPASAQVQLAAGDEYIPQDDTRHTLPLYDPQPEG